VIGCEAIFDASDERITIRHDASYVAGTLLAVRLVAQR
jgi:dihydrodipicolinate reductase